MVESWYTASGWHAMAIYAPLAYSATYWSLAFTPFHFILQELVRTTILGFTLPKLQQCYSWVRVMDFPFCSISPLLNFNGLFTVSFSYSLDRNCAL